MIEINHECTFCSALVFDACTTTPLCYFLRVARFLGVDVNAFRVNSNRQTQNMYANAKKNDEWQQINFAVKHDILTCTKCGGSNTPNVALNDRLIHIDFASVTLGFLDKINI